MRQRRGRTGPDKETPNPAPPEEPAAVSSRFESEDTNFLPGEIQHIVVEEGDPSTHSPSASLLKKTSGGSYETLSDSDLKLYLDTGDGAPNMLFLFIPVEEPGEYRLEFTIDDQQQSLDFSIAEYEPVENPDQFIEEEIQVMNEEWDSYEEYLQGLVEQEAVDAEVVEQDLATWKSIAEQARQEWEAMDASQKQWVSAVLTANKSWPDRLGSLHAAGQAVTAPFLRGPGIGIAATRAAKQKMQTCGDLRAEGVTELNNGNTFTAGWIALKYKWCQVDLAEQIFPKEDRGKTRILWEATENQFAQITLINLIGRKIDQATRWFDDVGNDTFVADRFEEAREKQAVMSFQNGNPKALYAQIAFRSIGEADAEGGPFAGFAALFSEQISLFDAFAGQLKEELVWRPGYRNVTETVSLNHFLSIDAASISNDKVMLLNTQRDGDRWEAAFATDEKKTQEFTFDLVYDDGRVKLRKTVSAEVVVKVPASIPPVMNGYWKGQFNQATYILGITADGIESRIMRGEDCFRYSNEFEIISRLPASGQDDTFSYTSTIAGKTYNVTLSMSGGSLLVTIKDATVSHTSVFTPAGYDWFMCPGV